MDTDTFVGPGTGEHGRRVADLVAAPLPRPPGGGRVPRSWVDDALRRIEADARRGADTHMHRFPVPASWHVDLYLKDESMHPTGSLKHRLARSLFLHGLVNGDIGPRTRLVDATSGSTAISEAYFARMLGLEFVAVVPRSTTVDKIDLIRAGEGRCHVVDHAAEIYAEAEELGARADHHYLDQFGRAAQVTDWRGNNNIASSIFEQMGLERWPVPTWIVVGAGTGGTSATIGRYLRYRHVATRLAVVDPAGSVLTESWRTGDRGLRGPGSRIEGIGRPRVEPSFVPAVIDEMLPVADADAVAAMRLAAETIGRSVGPSTGANLVGALSLARRMAAAGTPGSIVTLIGDSGERYRRTFADDDWVWAQGWELDVALDRQRAGLTGPLTDADRGRTSSSAIVGATASGTSRCV